MKVFTILLCQKPIEGTYASNCLERGCGGLNIDGSRVGTTVETWPKSRTYSASDVDGHGSFRPGGKGIKQETQAAPAGRFPANVILDASYEVTSQFPEAKTGDIRKGTYRNTQSDSVARGHFKGWDNVGHKGDSGSASRFFKQVKDDTV